MDDLAENDYVTADQFIDDEMYTRIMNFFREKEENDQLTKAGIGSSGEFKVDSSVRGDFIYWLERDNDQKMETFFSLMDELVDALRKYCYLSLSGSDFYILKFQSGSNYKDRLDKFNNRSNRMITVLVDLNEAWKPGDGGELKIYG